MKNYKELEEYDNIAPLPEEVFRSRLLGRMFGGLDDKVYNMEMLIEQQKEEIQELNRQISQNVDNQLREGARMINTVLLACLDKAPIEDLGPAAATVLVRIKDMQTVEEIHQYIDSMIGSYRERNPEKTDGHGIQ